MKNNTTDGHETLKKQQIGMIPRTCELRIQVSIRWRVLTCEEAREGKHGQSGYRLSKHWSDSYKAADVTMKSCEPQQGSRRRSRGRGKHAPGCYTKDWTGPRAEWGILAAV